MATGTVKNPYALDVDTTTLADIASAGPNVNLTSGKYCQWGKKAFISLIMKPTANLSWGATVATIVSDKRPADRIYVIDSSNSRASIYAGGSILIQHSQNNGEELALNAVYMLP